MSSKKVLKFLCTSCIIIFFVLLFKNTNFNVLVREIQEIKPKIIVQLIALQIITQLLLGIQWHRIANKITIKTSFFDMFYILSSGNVIEAITPGAKIGGEATRLYYLKKELKVDTNQAINIILIQKCISMSVLFTLCIVSFMYISTNLNFAIGNRVVICVISILLILMLICLLFFADNISKICSKSEKKYLKKIVKFAENYAKSTKMISLSEWILQFFISTLVWVLFPFKMVILAESMRIGMSHEIIVAITMTSYMIGMLPITPGGIGTFEGTMISIFTLLPVCNEEAFTATIVFRLITFWFVLIFSSIYVLIYKRRKSIGNKRKS